MTSSHSCYLSQSGDAASLAGCGVLEERKTAISLSRMWRIQLQRTRRLPGLALKQKKSGYRSNRLKALQPCTLKIENSGVPVAGLLRILVDEHAYPGEEHNHKTDCKQTGNHCVINKHLGISASVYG